MDAEARGREALRTRRRRRRLRGVRVARRHRGDAGAGPAARAPGRPDRELRGVGQLRPAGLPRGARAAHRRGRFRRRPRLGRRRLRAAVGDDVACAASRPARSRSTCLPRACTPATRRAWCRRRSASRAGCSTGSRTARPAASCRRRSTRRSPPSASSRHARPPRILGEPMIGRFPWHGGTRPMIDDRAEAVLNRTWRPALSVTGADGLPPIANAGNVLRPSTRLKLSLRLPPTIDARRRDGRAREAVRGRSAARRDRALRTRPGRHRMERAADRAVARRGDRVGVARLLRQAGRRARRGRHDPVHGHARQGTSRTRSS